MKLRLFDLVRDTDVSGVSGTGYVAEGVVFSDGVAVIRWRGENRSTAIYESIHQLEIIHGHDGKTKVVFK